MRVLALATGLLIALAGAPARGEDCARPDVVDTVPVDGARDVPINARLIARYAINAQYFDEPVMFGEAETELSPFPATYVESELLLTFTPPAELTPGVEYEVEWPGLRGLNTANKGRSRKLRFLAGNGVDSEPPRFDGLLGVDWDFERETDECTDSVEERFFFELEIGTAEDDGGRDTLSLVVFQTRGPAVDPNAPKPVHVGHFPAPGERVRVYDTVERTTGDVCFAALARDSRPLGVSSGGQEHCVSTVEPPFFEGCSVASRGSWWPMLLALGAALLRRKGRRSSPAPER